MKARPSCAFSFTTCRIRGLTGSGKGWRSPLWSGGCVSNQTALLCSSRPGRKKGSCGCHSSEWEMNAESGAGAWHPVPVPVESQSNRSKVSSVPWPCCYVHTPLLHLVWSGLRGDGAWSGDSPRVICCPHLAGYSLSLALPQFDPPFSCSPGGVCC
jgi:hypothetical protein